MPWNPGIQYRGDQYIAQGFQNVDNAITGIGDETMKALQRYQDIQKQKAFGDAVMEHAAQTPGPDGKPYVPIDALNKYHSSGLSAQAGIVQATQANMAADMQRIQMERQNELAKAQEAYYAAHGRYMDARATADNGDETTQIDPVTDPTTGKPVPGMGVVRKTGAIVSTTAPENQVQLDPTGKFFFDSKTRSWKPLPAATMVMGMNSQGNPQQPQGAPTFPQTSGGAAPQLPVQPGVTPGAPSLMPNQAATPAMQQQAAAVKAQYTAGQITRDQAIAQLQQLGMQ